MGEAGDLAESLHLLKVRVETDTILQIRVPLDSPEREKVKKYQAWVEKNGGSIKKCKVKFYSNTQSYLTATQDIAKDEDVLSIPYQMWMPLE